MNNQSGKPCDE